MEALILAVTLAAFVGLLLLVSWPGVVCAKSGDTMNAHNHLTVGATLGDLLEHPALAGFSRHMLPQEPDRYDTGMERRQPVARLLTIKIDNR